ncbi:DUF6161 domain-containing protein [Bosea sp. Tri-44]|uniref:DUF6161 domain-containing protein n=1 Tax=Bosea sp. Tri-44 TaxID=1972137 RepID=UPI00100ED0B7|nr:DUF6161 domain-containing protein [Bosea sp. Tri-44]
MATRIIDLDDQMDEIEFFRMLETKELQFDDNRDAEARETSRNQPEYWKEFTRTLSEILASREDRDAFAHIKRAIELSTEGSSPTLNKNGATPILTSDIPILREQITQRTRVFVAENPWFAIAATLLALAHRLAAHVQARSAMRAEATAALLNDPRMTSAFLQVGNVRTVEWEVVSRINRMTETANQLKEQRETIAAEAKNLGDLQARLSDEVREAKTLNDDLYKLKIENINEEWKQLSSEIAAEHDALKKQTAEAFVLEGAETLWEKKASGHAKRFWWGLAAMTLVVGSGILLFYIHGKNFIFGLSPKNDGDLPYAVLAMIGICVVSIAWVLRFLARFIHENMILQTDSTHRRAMLQTYLALVGDKGAKMESTDRVLVLNAIFRPLPGHQAEDVAPPTVLDLAKSTIASKSP